MTQALTTRVHRVWLDDGGIVHCECLPGAKLCRADAEHAVSLIRRIAGRSRPLLVDMRLVHSIDRPAREYFASPAGVADVTALALVVGSPLTRAIANFCLGLHAPPMPQRLFTSEGDALAWLRSFLD